MRTIGQHLRQWRTRRGLSQLALALAAGVSPRHVSLVETGKSHPTAEMILRLARPLDVPLRDRNQLLLAAGFAPRYPERPLDNGSLSAARGAVARVLRAHEPYPALVFDRRWNILMTNRAVDRFFARVVPELLRPPVNLVRLAEVRAGLPTDLEEVIMRCLEKEPARRFPSVGALEKALADCQAAGQWTEELAARWWQE